MRAMIDFAREGDTIYVSEFSRLARSTKDLLSIIQDLREKGVQVISLKENFDTSTPAGELTMTVFAAIATFERKIMLQRQADGIAVAKAKGVYKGRQKKKKPADWDELVKKYQNREIRSVSELMRICHASRPTVYMWLKESGVVFHELEWQKKRCHLASNQPCFGFQLLAPSGSIGCESLNGALQFGQPLSSPQLSQ